MAGIHATDYNNKAATGVAPIAALLAKNELIYSNPSSSQYIINLRLTVPKGVSKRQV